MPETEPDDASQFRPVWWMTNHESVGDAVITTDFQGRITFLNPVAESLTGWTRDEAVGVSVETVFKIIHADTRLAVESPIVHALRNGEPSGLPTHTVLVAKNGEEYPIGPIDHSASPIRNDQGELTGAVLVFRDITALYLQERMVRAALAYADNIIETLREPFLVLDTSFRVKSANRAFYDMFQVEKEQTENRLIYELGGGQWEMTQLRALHTEVLAGSGPVRDFNVEIEFPGIGKKTMMLNARRFGSEKERPDLILLAIQDITDRKRAEDELRLTEHRQRFILESIPQKLVTAKPDGGVDYFNPQWMEYTGLPFEQLKDFGWMRIIHPDDVDEHLRLWRNATQTGEVFEHESRFRRADGEYHWHVSRGVPMRNESGQIVMWVGANTDIHDIKLIELALIDSETRYRRLFETAKDGILILDTDSGRITDANPYMGELLGYSHEQFLGKQLWEIGLFSDKSANEAAVRTVQDKGYIRYEHLPLETSRGERVQVEVVANAYRVDSHNVIQCNIRDITERSRLEKQMQEQSAALADLHRRKDEFLAMLSHELRNPLAPIINAVQLLGLQANEGPVQKQARVIIERQVGQLTRLVDELLEVSRITTGRIHLRPERVGLNSIVERALETARPLLDKHAHELTVSLSLRPIWLNADPARMEQVIVNLLTNAAKYTPDRGRISLTVDQENDEAVVRVQDTGVGIPPELLPHIFDLFTQAERSLDRSHGGLGIGLSLVRRLVEMHGGRVEVSSVVGQGSEFVLRLPVNPTLATPPPPALETPAAPTAPSLRLLVVDDNVDAAQSLGVLLESAGHKVRLAYDGLGAVAAALEFQPEVVLLDIGLPQLDGFEVARRLRQEPSLEGVVLVAMTGYGQAADKLRSRDAGFNHHLVKPVDFRKVTEILATVSEKAP